MSEDALPPGLAAIAAGVARAAAPPLAIHIAAPDLTPHLPGNALPGVWTFAGAESGPHVAIAALVHGNEIAGAIVLDRWLRAGLRPMRGRLSLVFANLDAYARFSPDDPTASRFVDEDLNRVWDRDLLDSGRRSCELRRARALRPFLDTVDVLLDIHSMLWPSDPLLLVGGTARAAELGLALAFPALIVADEGHAEGRRLLDYAPFADPLGHRTAVLVEAGAHWEAETVAVAAAAAAGLLRHARLCADDEPILPPAPAPQPTRFATVTRTVTARATGFTFLQPYRGGQVIAARDTIIALDGEEEIRTPHDDCLLVMPSLRVAQGQTAVRLARLMPG